MPWLTAHRPAPVIACGVNRTKSTRANVPDHLRGDSDESPRPHGTPAPRNLPRYSSSVTTKERDDHRRRERRRAGQRAEQGRFGAGSPGICMLGIPKPWHSGGETLTGPQIDYAAVFRDLPIPVLLLTQEYVIAGMNLAYLQVTGRKREELVGRGVFDAFPDDPSNPGTSGVRDLTASLDRVLATSEPDFLSLQKYDVEVPGSPGLFTTRYWSLVNAPVFGTDGRVALIANCVEEVTDRIRKFVSGLATDTL